MKLQILIALTTAVCASAQTPEKAHAMKVPAILLVPTDMKYMPAPLATGMPSAVQMTVLSGDPSKPGLFTIRLKIPAGGKIPAHWHPTDENVSVLEGTFAAGMGDKLDESAMKEFPVGSFLTLPKRMNHFAMAKADTLIQIHAMGPFVLNYVNPADDPRKAK
jgi:anti-sigma factor ChrR (cupin superfamily)